MGRLCGPEDLRVIAGLCRIQWVAPTFARLLVEAGFRDVEAVRDADPEEFHRRVQQANEGSRFTRGTVGLRDIRRLVAAANYVPR